MSGIKKNEWIYLAFFFGIVILLTLVLNSYYGKKEFTQEIHFVVDKIEQTPSLRCYYYDENGDRLILNSYTFYAPSEIQKGDIITKQANSNELVIYRFGNSGEKQVFQIIKIK
ncbi:hypothetical protein ACYSNM_12715 [Myroides sp. LJL116]